LPHKAEPLLYSKRRNANGVALRAAVSGPAKAFREVVSAVIVDLRQADEKYQYEIKGWLSAVVGEELLAVLM